jgi:hypothetical protein
VQVRHVLFAIKQRMLTPTIALPEAFTTTTCNGSIWFTIDTFCIWRPLTSGSGGGRSWTVTTVF